ncbi:MAG: hypothetical protein JWM00_352 [Candidatus Saccharibacteria bacterium]|nr:hypothetical protein [Candidatus Saccharibacteria bacterium]
MSEYESNTHLSKSDRVLIYMGFGFILVLTVMLYMYHVDGFSRLSLYVTVIVFIPTSWAWLSGRYSKKFRRMASQQAEQANLFLVPSPHEARYAYKGEVKPLAEALGQDI